MCNCGLRKSLHILFLYFLSKIIMKFNTSILYVVGLCLLVPLITKAQRTMYVLSKSDHAIYSYALGSEQSQEVFFYSEGSSFLYAPMDIAYHAGRNEIIGALSKKDIIGAISLEDKSIRRVRVREVDSPIDVEVDEQNDLIYWLDHENNTVYRCNLKGKEKEEVLSDSLHLSIGLALSTEQNLIFWTTHRKHRVYKMDLEERNIEILNEEAGASPLRLAIDEENEEIYWTDDLLHKVCKIKFDGTNYQEIYKGGEENYPFAIYFDDKEQKIYWSDYWDKTVKRANRDGSDIETIITDINEPLGIVITNTPSQAILPNSFDIPTTATSQRTEVDLSPNPTGSILNVSVNQKLGVPTQIQIIDSMGKLLYELEEMGSKCTLDISALPEGIYYCRIQLEQQTITKLFSVIK